MQVMKQDSFAGAVCRDKNPPPCSLLEYPKDKFAYLLLSFPRMWARIQMLNSVPLTAFGVILLAAVMAYVPR